MKKIILLLFLGAFLDVFAQETAADSGVLHPNKVGLDIRVGLNQASTGGIVHIAPWLALNPYILYRSEEQTNNYLTDPGSGYSSTYNTSKESYFGVGGYIPIYVARIENLHVRLMPGFSYSGGKLSRSQTVATSVNYNQSANVTRIAFQFFIGLQYALNKHLHVFGETGFNYAQYKTNFYTDTVTNFYSGNIGLMFYFN